ncbi:MAG: Crp/Fnr family transcriptional regulator [Ignavibacteria bacterium]|nr:Crp/Fnr family transcriptional regulator [Ignavibacteria bacterium]
MKPVNCIEDIIKNYREPTQFIFHKNDVIFNENDEPSGIYYIKSGSVKLFKQEPYQNQRILYLANSGEILGLHSVVNCCPFTNSAAAVSETVLSFVSASDFMNLVDSNNSYKLLVMKNLCSRIDSMENHIVRINDKLSDERFADTLKLLIDKYGLNNSKILNVNISLDELASYTCISKSYMKKIIADFTQRGILTYSSGNIKILNLSGLISAGV